MVMKFNKQGIVTMVLGRKDEAIDYIERYQEEGQKREGAAPNGGAGRPNSFDRPTDVAWDTQGNVFVADGYGNSRVAKYSKDGEYMKTVGTRGNGPDSSARRTRSPTMPRATSTSAIAATTGSRFTIPS